MTEKEISDFQSRLRAQQRDQLASQNYELSIQLHMASLKIAKLEETLKTRLFNTIIEPSEGHTE